MITRIIKRLVLSLAVVLLAIAGVKAQAIKVNLDYENEPLLVVLNEITKQTSYNFIYDNSVVDVAQKVTIKGGSKDLKQLLDKVFKGTGITYRIAGRQIALSVVELASPAKENKHTLRGKITDESGNPLIGADVIVKGSYNGVVADIDGNYTIELGDAKDAVLIFGYLGMISREISVGGLTLLNVALQSDSKMIDEVVVTGYQQLSRERTAGSFSVVSGSSMADNANSSGSIIKGLEGTASGLSVVSSAEGTQYMIRGITSINSNSTPLFIVDGVQIEQEQIERYINSSDIDKVTFLKDATAASIWGAQAANGVVVISTKSGAKDGNLSISYNGNYTYTGLPDYDYRDMMSSADFIRAAQEVFDPYTFTWDDVSNINSRTFACVYPHELPLYQYFRGEIDIVQREAELQKLASQNGRREYEKYFMSHAMHTNQSIAFSGGNKVNDYYISLGYTGSQGTSKDTSNEFRVYMKDHLNVNSWLSLDLSINASYGKSKYHLFSHDYDEGYRDLVDLPYLVYYDSEGNELSLTQTIMNESIQSTAERLSGINLDYYAVSDYLASTSKTTTQGLRANLGVNISLCEGLNYQATFLYSTGSSNTETYLPSNTFKVRLDRVYATSLDGNSYLPSSGGHFTMGDGNDVAYTIRNQFGYNWESSDDKHQIVAIAGAEISSNKSSYHSMFVKGYDLQTMQYIDYDDYSLCTEGVRNPVLSQLSGTNSIFTANSYSQSEIEYRFVSFYANAGYTLLDKYSLNASVRVDQSNLFGSDPSVQFKPIWSLGTIWNVLREDFMQSFTKINSLNLRFSYGFAGNSPSPGQGGPYNILASTSDIELIRNYSQYGLGYNISTPANDKLTWEKTRTWNIGVDFAILAHRISGSLDIYDKRTTDLLAPTLIDPTTGFKTVLANVGTMTNKGVELSLSTANIVKKDFRWSTDFNFSYNANMVEALYTDPATSPYAQAMKTLQQGYPMGALFAYCWAGLDPTNGRPRVYNSDGSMAYKTEELDSIDAVKFMGSTIPPFYGSLTNNLRYKNWQLSFMFIYNLGHKMRNDTNTVFSDRLTSNLHNDFTNRWREPGDEKHTDVPAYFSAKDTSYNPGDYVFYQYADINVLSASYIKLRNISLTYNLPARLLGRLSLDSGSVTAQVSNLGVIAFNGEGIDPEAHSLSYGARGDKFGPIATVSINLNF